MYRGSVCAYRDDVCAYRGSVRAYRGDVYAYRASVRAYRGDVCAYRASVRAYRGSVRAYQGCVGAYRCNLGMCIILMNKYWLIFDRLVLLDCDKYVLKRIKITIFYMFL